MSGLTATLLVAIFCCTYAAAESLDNLVTSTETDLQSAKTHVNHMLSLSPLPHADKIPSIIHNETGHLSEELKKLATTLHEKISVGEHKQEVKDAVTGAITHLNEAATGLEASGSDLKQENEKYYTAAEKLLQEVKSVAAAGPCEQISPTLQAALKELKSDFDRYQWGIHEVIGVHEGAPDATGHHDYHDHHHNHDLGSAHHDHHHNHDHGSASNEDSNESDSHHHHH